MKTHQLVNMYILSHKDEIKKQTFLHYTNINTLLMPEGVTDLGKYIFPDKIKNSLIIVFPSTLKKISADEPFRRE